MREKNKRIVIDDVTYQIKRFPADVGSFILGRILNAGTRATLETLRAMAVLPSNLDKESPDEGKNVDQSPKDIDGAIRRLAAQAFGVMVFEERSIVQRRCLEVCARMEAEDAPMPLCNATGALIDDLTLVMRLEMEALVFNFHDFFDQGGPNALLQTPAPQSL